jgi:tetratricopeptide (TPR) repeat protein
MTESKPRVATHSSSELYRHALDHHQRGQLQEAISIYDRIIAIEPDHAPVHFSRSAALGQLGRYDEALAGCDRVIALRPDYAQAHGNRGNALRLLGRFDEALASCDRAIALNPDFAEGHHNRGDVLNELGRHAEALTSYGRAAALKPDYIKTYYNQALNHHQRHQLPEAIAYYDRVIALQSDHVDAHYNRGLALFDLDRHEEAAASWKQTSTLKPDHANSHYSHGAALKKLGRYGEALASYDRAIALKPDFADAYHNRANALCEFDRYTEALADYDRAIALKPDFFQAHNGRGLTLEHLGRREEALADFNRAIKAAPQYATAQFSKALLLLRLGRYNRNTLQLFEAYRHLADAPKARKFRQPQWRGEPVAGNTILLYPDQGLGDSIQMLRYLPLVQARGARIVLELHPPIQPLLGPMANDITVIDPGSPLPPFDVQCPMMSLLLALDTRLDSIPARVPYLAAPAERGASWRARLPKLAGLRVGLVWSGRPEHSNDRNRSIALDRLAPLFAVPGISFVSLQQEFRAGDLAALGRFPIERIDDGLADFGDTAAAIEQCDLVISVDTSVAHLAGSLGKPLWLLLPHLPDWRWLLGRTDSPWYPTARLFRQSRTGDWDGVIANVAKALLEFQRPGAAPLPELYRRALDHHQRGQFQEAIAIYDRVIALKPNHAQAHNNRGAALGQLGRYAEALASCDHAIVINPAYAQAHDNRANAIRLLGYYDEALASCDRAIAIKPDYAEAYDNRGIAFYQLGRREEALADFDRAIALKPQYPNALFNRSLLLLADGNYEEGLLNYEWGLHAVGVRKPRGIDRPQWRGEPIADKTIFLHAEQGYGDSIQMLRYLPMVKAKAAHVILELPKTLRPLLGSMADGITLPEPGSLLPPFDVICPLMSLPLAFSTRLDTIPSKVPYLTAPAERAPMWRDRLPKSTMLRVGLVGSGSTTHQYDRNRSVGFDQLAPWFDIAGISLVSLQREYRDSDLNALSRLPITRIDDKLADFGDTAAAIEQCDLVISVDTSVAHLAGSLGKPVWVLLSFVSDWRWQRDRTDSLWYPTARLFRQSRIGDWSHVIDDVGQALLNAILVLKKENLTD